MTNVSAFGKEEKYVTSNFKIKTQNSNILTRTANASMFVYTTDYTARHIRPPPHLTNHSWAWRQHPGTHKWTARCKCKQIGFYFFNCFFLIDFDLKIGFYKRKSFLERFCYNRSMTCQNRFTVYYNLIRLVRIVYFVNRLSRHFLKSQTPLTYDIYNSDDKSFGEDISAFWPRSEHWQDKRIRLYYKSIISM